MIEPDEVEKRIIEITKSRRQWRSKDACRGVSVGDFKKKMLEEHSDFLKKCPILFEKAVNGDFEKKDDQNKLKYMLSMMSKVNKKTHTFEDASKEVGQRFADEYVKPLVEKLDKEKKEREAK